jgi:uncharacterized membrane protein
VSFDFLWDFLYRHFIVPGYDWVDTPTYGLVLGLLVIFAVVPVLKRLKVNLDGRFFTGTAPFIIMGATARELVDRKLGVYALAGDYPRNFWLVSPWIFFTMFFITVACMLAAMAFSRKVRSVSYHIPMFALGAIPCAYNLALIALNIKHLSLLLEVTAIFGLFMAFIWFSARIKVLSFLKNEFNILVVAAHMLDASATYVGVDYLGFGEQHVLPSLLIKIFGTAAVMFPLKLIVLLPALYVIDDELKNDPTARRFIKFVILILGLGPAIRDIVMMIL